MPSSNRYCSHSDDDSSIDNYSDDEPSYCCDSCKKKEREREHCKRCNSCKKREHCKKYSSCKKNDKYYKNKDKKETVYGNEIKYSKDCIKDGKCIVITIN
jgi:hypothetical protein